jgi:hypothetical protein
MQQARTGEAAQFFVHVAALQQACCSQYAAVWENGLLEAQK